MAITAQVVLETESRGRVTVRAKAPGNRANDAKPIAGFFGAKRYYAGQTFRINDWQQFSPRWMEFVDEPPAEWIAKIQEREKTTEVFVAKRKAEDSKTVQQRQFGAMFSMFQVQASQAGLGKQFDAATGSVKDSAALADLTSENARLKAELEAAKADGKGAGKSK